MWIIVQAQVFQQCLTGVFLFMARSLAQNAPFLNATSTKNFQTEKDKGSRWPIFEIKTVFSRGKIDLPFAVRWFVVGNKGFQKIALENDFHIKKWPNFEYFQVQKDNHSTS